LQPEEVEEIVQLVWLRHIMRRTPFHGDDAIEQRWLWLREVAYNETRQHAHERGVFATSYLDAFNWLRIWRL